MINKKIIVFFLACFVVNVHSRDGIVDRMMGLIREPLLGTLSAFQKRMSFNQLILPMWQRFYAPVIKQGNQLAINNGLTYWLVQNGLWNGTAVRGVNAVAGYAFGASQDCLWGSSQVALQNLKEELATDAIVTPILLAAPRLDTVLNTTKIHPKAPIPLVLIAREVVRSYVVRPYIFPPKKQESANILKLNALDLAINRYQKTLRKDVLDLYNDENRVSNRVKYLRILECLAEKNSVKGPINKLEAERFGFEPIDFLDAQKKKIQTADIASSGKPYCVYMSLPSKVE